VENGRNAGPRSEVDGERVTRSGTGSGKPPVTAGSNGQRPAQYGYEGRKPQSELELDGDKLAETGDER